MTAAPGLRRTQAALRLAWRAGPPLLCAHATLTLCLGLLPVSVAWLTKLILDRLVQNDTSQLTGLSACLVVAGAAVLAGPQLQRYADAELGRRIKYLAQGRLMESVGAFRGLARLEDPSFQDRLHLALQAGQYGAGSVLSAGLTSAQALISLGGFVVTLWTLNPVMVGLVLLATAPTLSSELRIGRARAGSMLAVGQSARREFFYTQLLTSVQAAKEIRLFDLGGFLTGRMLEELRRIQTETRRVDRKELARQALLSVLAAGVAGAGLLWAIWAASAHRLTIGDISVFIAAVAGVQAAANALMRNGGQGYQAMLLFAHYQAVIEAGPDLPSGSAAIDPPPLRHGIELRDVWFRYSDDLPWVLRGVSMLIPHANAVALVGVNGAGKSTLIKLLCRLYDPTRGSVLWDGVDLRDLEITALRQRIGGVFQDFMSYDLTAAENIALGDLALLDDEAEIQQAATRAGCHETIAALPSGYRTLLTRTYSSEGDRHDPKTGVVLSGGQWQRIALARALLRHSRDLLILDEPSSGLDAHAEYEMHRSITAHRAGTTSVLISHRLSTVRQVDRVVVLSGGRIIEQGTHDELMSLGGEYASLFALQAGGYLVPAAR